MTRILHGMAFGLLLTASLPSYAEGGIALGQTRVIFSAENKAQSITVSNSGDVAFLIHARVQTNPDGGESSPFIVTPPLYSLQGGSRQVLRILRQDGELPTDRESLFYLSVAAIPSQQAPLNDRDRVSVGMRFVVKLFYRPEGLILSAEENACRLIFRQTADGVRIENPTEYFQTLGKLTINGRMIALAQQPVMVPPREHLIILGVSPPTTVTWQTVNDHGGLSTSCRQVAAVH